MAWKLPPDQDAMAGIYSTDAPYQLGDFQRSGPQMRPVGIGETIARALLPQRDEQGIPKPMGAGDAISAALWAVPGARGTIGPRPFQGAPQAANFNRSPAQLQRDQIRAELNEGIERMRQQTQGQAELGGRPLVLDPAEIQDAIRRRIANSEALASGVQPSATLGESGGLIAEYGQRLKQALGNREAWGPLMQELQADARLTHPDLVRISSEFYGGIPPSSSRAKAIENIQKRHNKLTSWKDELDSGVLK